MSTVPLPNIVDGFMYNTMLWSSRESFYQAALSQLDILRRAANYRARWFVVPDDINQPVLPYDTLYYQISVTPGSYLWGYRFGLPGSPDSPPILLAPQSPFVDEGPVEPEASLSTSALQIPEGMQPTSDLIRERAIVEQHVTDCMIQVVDSATAIPLFQDFISGGGASINFPNVRMLPILLTQPRLVRGQGLVNVQITNRTSQSIFCQLLLHFAEPCKTIEDATERS